MTIRSILHAPERFLSVALTFSSLAIAAFLCCSPAARASGQMETGDPRRGQELYQKRCASCHSLDGEKKGPRLRGIFGRRSAGIQSFTYSEALKSANIVWDVDSLDKWLADTDKFIPDNDMNISVKNPQERSDLIAYLKQVSGR